MDTEDAVPKQPHPETAGERHTTAAVERLVTADRTSGAIAIVSHGAVGTLLYCQLTNTPIGRRFDQPSNGGGNRFRFTLSPLVMHSWRVPIDDVGH